MSSKSEVQKWFDEVAAALGTAGPVMPGMMLVCLYQQAMIGTEVPALKARVTELESLRRSDEELLEGAREGWRRAEAERAALRAKLADCRTWIRNMATEHGGIGFPCSLMDDEAQPAEPVSSAYTLPGRPMASALDVRPTVPPLLERLDDGDPYAAKVREFHAAMGLPVRDVPDVGTDEERVLGGRLILEEVLEFLRAAGVRVRLDAMVLGIGDVVVEVDADGPGPDLVQMLHELADLQYVVSGRRVQFGLPVLTAVAEEIHPANMRKSGPDGRPVRRADGKVIKPAGWQPADVSRVLQRVGESPLSARIHQFLVKLGHEPTPITTSAADALHPSGRCTCAGEGACSWCRARCDVCGSPYVPEAVRHALGHLWGALHVTDAHQGIAVAVLRAVYPELPVPTSGPGADSLLAWGAVAHAVTEAARLGAEDMRERAARAAGTAPMIEVEERIRKLPLPGAEVSRG
jgi:predicted HAD superfamily Cof-like phosphohydrolase